LRAMEAFYESSTEMWDERWVFVKLDNWTSGSQKIWTTKSWSYYWF
jgi:hypothetical protein